MISIKYIGFGLLILVIVLGSAYYFLQAKNLVPQESCLNSIKKHMKLSTQELSTYPSAVFAGGCFWCTESDFQKLDGVKEVVSGYSGGAVENPTYEEVSAEKTGHRESVRVYFDPQKVSYQDLVRRLLTHINPTDAEGQFYDRGESYTSAIFYMDEEQKRIAEEAIKELDDSKIFDKPVAVKVLPYSNFYEAEDYHQDYSENNTVRYCAYRNASGRDDFIKQAWGDAKWIDGVNKNSGKYSKPSDGEIKSMLTDLQYKVTQQDATEKPFDNEYWDTKDEGIYVDIVTGEPLFSSLDKYDSGTGWPSFTKPIDKSYLNYKTDKILFYERTEVESKIGGSHLGHVFDDGPQDKGGKRYCLNSASLRFVPKDKLEQEGYGQYLGLFK